MGIWGTCMVGFGIIIPVFMVSWYFMTGTHCRLRTWLLIGLPFIAIGISGVLFTQADSYRSTPEQVLIYGGVLYVRRKHIAEGKISARGRTEAPAQGAGCKATGRVTSRRAAPRPNAERK